MPAARKMFGQTLADFQLTQAEARRDGDRHRRRRAADLPRRLAARLRGRRRPREAAMAKMTATENAQQRDRRGACRCSAAWACARRASVERLYREIRALRIYEGATEVQKLIIAREMLKEGPRDGRDQAAGEQSGVLAARILQPPGWAKPVGYSNGVAARGRMVFVGGQIGWNGQGVSSTDDFVGQIRQGLQNVVAVLRAGGAARAHRPHDLVFDRQARLSRRRREIGAAYAR